MHPVLCIDYKHQPNLKVPSKFTRHWSGSQQNTEVKEELPPPPLGGPAAAESEAPRLSILAADTPALYPSKTTDFFEAFQWQDGAKTRLHQPPMSSKLIGGRHKAHSAPEVFEAYQGDRVVH